MSAAWFSSMGPTLKSVLAGWLKSKPLTLAPVQPRQAEPTVKTTPTRKAFYRNAASAISGALSSTLSRALAAPVGLRLPCSQLRMVSSGTSMRLDSSA